jgi:hypothetical protein
LKRVDIDFIANSSVPRWAVVLGGLFLALSLIQTWQALQLERERLTLADAFLQPLDRSRGAQHIEAAPSDDRRVPLYAREAIQIAMAAGFDVGQVLAAIESAQVEGVRVRSLDVQTTERSIRLDIEFVSAVPLGDYLSSLNVGLPDSEHWQMQRVVAPTADSTGRATLLTRASFGVR